MARLVWAIEFIDEVLPYDGESGARRWLDWLRTNDGYRGGRLLPPVTDRRGWRVQAFFADTPEAAASPHLLPDGCGRRLVPVHLLNA